MSALNFSGSERVAAYFRSHPEQSGRPPRRTQRLSQLVGFELQERPGQIGCRFRVARISRLGPVVDDGDDAFFSFDTDYHLRTSDC
jgi:hypothetical protein